jgi:4-oxalocrotonate tautomerase
VHDPRPNLTFGEASSSVDQPEEFAMPFLNVKLIEGVFDDAQKKDMIAQLTETMVSIEGENMRAVTWVVIEEVASGEWGIGGNPLTTADVKALAAG